MNKFIPALLFAILQLPHAYAQVRLNVTFHSIEDLRLNNITCKKTDKDLIIETQVESFATQPSFIRYELLQLERNQSYLLKHHDFRDFLISDNSPAYLATIKAGTQLHQFTLRFKNTSFSQCNSLKENIRISIEPL